MNDSYNLPNHVPFRSPIQAVSLFHTYSTILYTYPNNQECHCEGVAQQVECLPVMFKVLGSVPSTTLSKHINKQEDNVTFCNLSTQVVEAGGTEAWSWLHSEFEDSLHETPS